MDNTSFFQFLFKEKSFELVGITGATYIIIIGLIFHSLSSTNNEPTWLDELACNMSADTCEDVIRLTQDEQEKLRYLERECSQGFKIEERCLKKAYELKYKGGSHSAVNLFSNACDATGSYGSCATIATIYANGEGVMRDKEKARQYLQKACRHGNYTRACDDLSRQYLFGMGVDQDIDKALELSRNACLQNKLNCYILYGLYNKGIAGSSDLELVKSRYKIGCEENDRIACFRLANLKIEETPHLRWLFILRRSCTADSWPSNCAEGTFSLSRNYSKRRAAWEKNYFGAVSYRAKIIRANPLFSKDLAEVRSYYMRGCNSIKTYPKEYPYYDFENCFRLIDWKAFGVDNTINYESIKEVFKKKCENGDHRACNNLVFKNYRDNLFNRDNNINESLKLKYSQLACTKNNLIQSTVGLCNILLDYYRTGLIKYRHFEWVNTYYKTNCLKGNVEYCAQYFGGYLRKHDLFKLTKVSGGLTTDYGRYRGFLESICSTKNIEPCTKLMESFEIKRDVLETVEWALVYQKKRCNVNDSDACSFLGSLYKNTNYQHYDLDLSKMYYRKSCQLGNTINACFELSRISIVRRSRPENILLFELYRERCMNYLEDESCHRFISLAEDRIILDKKVLANTYEEVCNLGYMVACSSLGNMYRLGEYIQKDFLLAEEYFKKACDNGYMYGCNSVGMLRFQERHIGNNNDIARQYFDRSCLSGDDEGCFNIANLIETSAKNKKDIDLADDYFDKTCYMWNRIECYFETNYRYPEYMLYSDASKSINRGIRYLTKKCIDLKANDILSSGYCYFLGDIYEWGKLSKDMHQARYFYSVGCYGSAETKRVVNESWNEWHYPSCIALAKLLRRGLGGPKDIGKTKAIYRRFCPGGVMFGLCHRQFERS